MAPPVARTKRPMGKAAIRESSEEPLQGPPYRQERSEPLSAEDSIPVLPADHTPGTASQTLPKSSANTEPEADLRRQINQSLSNNLGTTVSLTEEQFADSLISSVLRVQTNQFPR
jgi:hypothetical protein